MEHESFLLLDTKGVEYDVDCMEEDVEEEGFKTPLINVKDLDPVTDNIKDEDHCTIKIPSTSYISTLYSVRHDLSVQEHELHRKITLDLRKFLYKSIVTEDFCLSCNIKEEDSKKGAQELCSQIREYVNTQSSLEIISEDEETLLSDISGTDSLASIKCDVSANAEEPIPDDGNDTILLEILPKQLNRIITEMAHVQMRTFFSSYPRAFKITYGNVSSEVYSLGRRFYISNDDLKNELQYNTTSHVAYLSHLYRKQRTVCYYCGFSGCSRTFSSRNPCDTQICYKCGNTHKWSSKSCRDDGSTVNYLLYESDWRIKREPLWTLQPKHVKECLKCFFCDNEGEANFKCQGISCKQGFDTLYARCLELIGAKKLRTELKRNPKLFPHMKKYPFVFN